MVKLIWLAITILIFLAIDGELTYDIFDFRLDTVSDWIMACAILVIFVVLYLLEKTRPDKPKPG